MVDIILSSNVLIRILFSPFSSIYSNFSFSELLKYVGKWNLNKANFMVLEVNILKVRTFSLSMYVYPMHWTCMIGCPWLFHIHTFKPSSRSRDKFYTTQKEVGE